MFQLFYTHNIVHNSNILDMHIQNTYTAHRIAGINKTKIYKYILHIFVEYIHKSYGIISGLNTTLIVYTFWI